MITSNRPLSTRSDTPSAMVTCSAVEYAAYPAAPSVASVSSADVDELAAAFDPRTGGRQVVTSDATAAGHCGRPVVVSDCTTSATVPLAVNRFTVALCGARLDNGSGLTTPSYSSASSWFRNRLCRNITSSMPARCSSGMSRSHTDSWCARKWFFIRGFMSVNRKL